MAVYIHDIVTKVPDFYYIQSEIREFMKEHVPATDDRLTRAIIHRLYSMSGIEKRHSVIPDFTSANPDGTGAFYDEDENQVKRPGTEFRNGIYTDAARKLYTDTAEELLANSGLKPSEITHVITASCTGFYAPGPDYDVVRYLGLSPSTRRYHIGFMGCYAAFPGLQMAKTICESEPDANVMVICCELCTIHLNFLSDTDSILSASVFSDGCAGAMVRSIQPDSGPYYEISGMHSLLTDDGEKDMTWTLGDIGFKIVLSTYVPDIIGSNIDKLVQPFLQSYNLEMSDIKHWAVHPGGRAILDRVVQGISIDESQIEASRRVLNDYGNMSSATIMFVLKEIMKKEPGDVIGIAFGPGLTVETAWLKLCH